MAPLQNPWLGNQPGVFRFRRKNGWQTKPRL